MGAHRSIGLRPAAWGFTLLLGAAFVAGAQQDTGRPSPFGPRLMGDAAIQFDRATGTVLVRTDEATNRQIEQLIQVLDRPVPHVHVEVLFIEITHNKDLDLGAELFYQSALDTDLVGNVERGISASTDFGVSGISEGVFYSYLEQDFEATLRTLARASKLEVLSRPAILAKNNETGGVSVGQEVPFIRNSQITNEGNTINTVEYEDIGVLLQVTPFVNPEGIVEMTVATEISTVTGDSIPISAGVSAPVFAKRSAETRVVAPGGQTIVIGGLMEDNETETVRGVPFLSKIPLIGLLFQRKGTSKTKTELLVFLTPTVLRPGEELTVFSRTEIARAEALHAALSEREGSTPLAGLPARFDSMPVRAAAPPPERRFVVESSATHGGRPAPRHSQVRRRGPGSESNRPTASRPSKMPGVFPGGLLYAAPSNGRQ